MGQRMVGITYTSQDAPCVGGLVHIYSCIVVVGENGFLFASYSKEIFQHRTHWSMRGAPIAERENFSIRLQALRFMDIYKLKNYSMHNSEGL